MKKDSWKKLLIPLLFLWFSKKCISRVCTQLHVLSVQMTNLPWNTFYNTRKSFFPIFSSKIDHIFSLSIYYIKFLFAYWILLHLNFFPTYKKPRSNLSHSENLETKNQTFYPSNFSEKGNRIGPIRDSIQNFTS